MPKEGNPNDNIQVTGIDYRDKGEETGGNNIGKLYDILLFEPDSQTFARFKAILACPYTYCETLVDIETYGIIAKVTTTSDIFMNFIIEMLTGMGISEKING